MIEIATLINRSCRVDNSMLIIYQDTGNKVPIHDLRRCKSNFI